MKVYKRRPGVVLVEICGESMLIATGDARDHCPYVTQVNQAAARWWTLLDEGATLPGLVEKAGERFGQTGGNPVFAALQFIVKMQDAGYLLAVDEP
jgi:hypothetical protein